MPMIELTDDNFEAEVIESQLPVLVDFSASWCGPCKMLEPVVEELSQEYAGKAKICHLDVDAARDTAMRFGITAVPTIMCFKAGRQAGVLQGVQPKPKLAATLDDLIG
jgi:thioredoxin 1